MSADWFAIVDGAADPRLLSVIRTSSQQACLYEDEYEDEVLAAMPHLVRLQQGEQLGEVWRQHESGRFWGMICQSPLGFSALRRHLRKFTTARLPDGEVVLFRFWDPRVFSVFAENAAAEEIGPFFDNIDAVIIDLGPGGRRRYSWNGGLEVSSGPPPTAAPRVSAQ